MMRGNEQDFANQGDKYVVIGSIKTRDGRLSKKLYKSGNYTHECGA
ncbi:hypothetical protein [Anaplasma phagocytophilum]|nr:hypothetical protein [Anaplasma phagocytophilum]